MTKVFISYRRDDTAYAAHAIYKKLIDHYGEGSVVFDVDTIPMGIDFVKHLNEEVSNCDVLLAVIGDLWLGAKAEDGRRRLENPKDFVRVEIQAALKRNIPVIPVLVGKASVPSASQLPRGMKSLSRRNAAEVRPGRDFDSHLNRLVRGLVSLQGIDQPQRELTPEEIFEEDLQADEGERPVPEAEQAPPPAKRADATAAPPASHGEPQIVGASQGGHSTFSE